MLVPRRSSNFDVFGVLSQLGEVVSATSSHGKTDPAMKIVAYRLCSKSPGPSDTLPVRWGSPRSAQAKTISSATPYSWRASFSYRSTPDRGEVLGGRIEIEPEDDVSAGRSPLDNPARNQTVQQDAALFGAFVLLQGAGGLCVCIRCARQRQLMRYQ